MNAGFITTGLLAILDAAVHGLSWKISTSLGFDLMQNWKISEILKNLGEWENFFPSRSNPKKAP